MTNFKEFHQQSHEFEATPTEFNLPATTFKEFYQQSQKFETTPTEFNLPATTAANIQAVLSPMIGISSLFSNTNKVEEFSKEVANYATSDDLISSLSEKIGKPKENETEQEFVERASHILREILKKRFNI